MGWGIYHDQMSGNAALLIAGLNPPYPGNLYTDGHLPRPAGSRETTVRHRRPRRAPLYAVWQRDFKTPYLHSYSFDIQHELWKNTVVTGGYYGSLGRRLIGYTEYNIFPRATLRKLSARRAWEHIPIRRARWRYARPLNTAFTATPTQLDQIRPFRGYRSLSLFRAEI